MSSLSGFDKIFQFERELAAFTGAPYAIMTDCCTHAIEMCLRYDNIKQCTFTPFTYISIPMTMHKLGIKYEYYPDTVSHRQHWVGEYKFELTRIWDSARRLEENMYRPGMMQCLSFGWDKPLAIGRGGAILLDDPAAYNAIIRMRYDGRDLSVSPWAEQREFYVGYHYKPTPEEAAKGIELLAKLQIDKPASKKVQYPDLRAIKILD